MMVGAILREIAIRMNVGKFAHEGVEGPLISVFIRNKRLPPARDDKQKEQWRKKDTQEQMYLPQPLKPFRRHGNRVPLVWDQEKIPLRNG